MRAIPVRLTAKRYEVFERIGQGSMAVVYRAFDRDADREVALKCLRAPDPEQIYRLKKEFRSLADLSHPNLVRLHAMTVENDQWFYSMELIEGVDFLEFSRPESGEAAQERWERVREVVRQLARGLDALHAAGKLHRDVKPTNVLVERTGRVVLLDFGLVSDVYSRASRLSGEGTMAGTLVYMAPEQAWGGRVSPASDWYSVGVMLYEALTGRPPHEGTGLRVVVDKFEKPVPPPRALAPDTPADLDALTLALLAVEPARRPTAADVLRSLDRPGEALGPAVSLAPPIPLDVDRRCVGRERELALLHESFRVSQRGDVASVFLCGASGIGKTTLLRRFTAEVEDTPSTLVLEARCHPEESIPFRAMDGLLDGLSRYLLRLPNDRLGELLPEDTAALARIFPVLARIPKLASQLGPLATREDLRESRRLAFRALRELLGRIARWAHLVLWIDDLQWGDADSIALLRELRTGPEPLPHLLVLTFRDEGGVRPLLESLVSGRDDFAPVSPPFEIELGPLDEPATRALVDELLAGSEVGDRLVDWIVTRSAGHPLLARELAASHYEPSPGDAAVEGDLERFVAERIRGLPAAARRILEALCLPGVPTEYEVVAGAAQVGEAAGAAFELLERDALIRYVGARDSSLLEPAHDRIRQATLEMLGDDARRTLHRRFVELLERRPDSEPEQTGRHHLGAGHTDRAASCFVEAAERAVAGLAFNRAARLYEEALALRAGSVPRWQLLSCCAAALANAGKGVEAARRYAEAAHELSALAPWDREAVDLRRFAAEHYLRAGYLDEGRELLRRVLSDLGLRYSATPGIALASLLVHRARLRVARLRGRRLRRARTDAGEAMRIDACWSAVVGVTMFDALRGAEFQARHAVLAYRSGNALDMARALGTEASLLTAEGGDRKRRRAQRLQIEAERLAGESADRATTAYTLFMAAASAYLDQRFAAAVRYAKRGEALCRESSVRMSWDLANMQIVALKSLAYLGEFRDVRTQLPELLHEADERCDQYAAVYHCVGMTNFAWLMADDPDEAERRLRWASGVLPVRPFGTPHYFSLLAQAHVDLYRGQARKAWETLTRAWSDLRRSRMLRLESVRTEMRHLRARCALAVAATAEPTSRTRNRLLEAALSDARAIAREQSVWSGPMALSLQGGLAALQGQHGDAIRHFDHAALGFDKLEMRLHAAAVRYRSSLLAADGRSGAGQRACAWMAYQGAERPERVAAVLVPGVEADSVTRRSGP